MGDWISVEGDAGLAEGQSRVVDLEGTEVLLLRHQGCVHAIENRCSHDGSDLSQAVLDTDGHLICPHHGARFDLRSGAALCAPAYEPVTVFPVRVEAGVIQVRDPRW